MAVSVINPWVALLSPFGVGAVIVGGIKAWDAYAKWRYNRDRRIRDERLARYNITAFRGAKDRFLS
jgi:hypothetical protein